MFSARSIASPALRTAFYSRPARVAFGHRAQFLPASVAAMSTVTEALTKDHRELEEYYNEVINSSDPDHQQRYGNQFTWELARHSVGEELIIYPAFEKYLGEKGKEIAESDRKQHHQVQIS
jgi:hemerythrin superfamily protein